MRSNFPLGGDHPILVQCELAEKFGLDCTALAREEGFIPPAMIWVSARLVRLVADASAFRFGLRRLLYMASRANRGEIPRIEARHHHRPVHLFQHVVSGLDGSEERLQIRIELTHHNARQILAITAADETSYWHAAVNWN